MFVLTRSFCSIVRVCLKPGSERNDTVRFIFVAFVVIILCFTPGFWALLGDREECTTLVHDMSFKRIKGTKGREINRCLYCREKNVCGEEYHQ